MIGTARIVEPGEGWDGLLQRFAASEENDVYFNHRYVTLYATGGKKAEAFAYKEDDSLFFLPLLLRAIDTTTGMGAFFEFETAYGYSGPLSTDRNPEFLNRAWGAFQAYCKEREIVAGLFRFHPLLENHELAEGSKIEVIDDRKTVFIDLDQDEEAIWRAYASDNRNRIRKSKKSGVVVTVHDDKTALRIFAAIYAQRMSELEADSDYFFGDDYFENFTELGPGGYKVYLAKRGAEIIGGAIILLSSQFAHYHLSSTPREYQRYAANNILRHAVIVSLLRGPYEKLHFGGGRTSDPEDSLLRFKSRFSKSRAQFFVGRYVADPAKYEAVCDAWKRDHLSKVAEYESRILCYRYT